MLNATRRGQEPMVRDDSRRTARLRLFGLLTLLLPLFGVLDYIVQDGVPRVEVRLVTQDVETTVPVEVPVERVVERIVYVPVARQETQAPDTAPQQVAVAPPSAPPFAVEPPVEAGENLPVEVAEAGGDEPEQPAPTVIGEAQPVEEPLPVIGSVAPAPPPIVARAPAPAPVRRAPLVAAVPPPTEEVEVAEAEPTADEPVADAGDEEVMAEAPPVEPAPETVMLVAQVVTEAPVIREDGGPSVAMVRSETYRRVPVPQAPAAADEAQEPAAEEHVADAEEAVAEPQEPADGAADSSTDELLEEARVVRTEVADVNGGSVVGVIENVLIIRSESTEPGPEPEAAPEPAPVEVAAEESEPAEAAEAPGQAEEAPADEAIVADGSTPEGEVEP